VNLKDGLGWLQNKKKGFRDAMAVGEPPKKFKSRKRKERSDQQDGRRKCREGRHCDLQKWCANQKCGSDKKSQDGEEAWARAAMQ